MRNPRQFDWQETGLADAGRAELGVREGSRRVLLDGVWLAIEEQGEGVPVVCLHHAGHGASDFHPLMEKSPADCHLVLVDWPGHGRSSDDQVPFTLERCVDLLGRLLNARGLRDAVLLGEDFGAAVAVAFAIEHPKRVRALALCEPAWISASRTARGAARLGPALKRGVRALLRRKSRAPADQQAGRIERVKALHALQVNQAALSMAAHREALRSGLAGTRCPVLLALAEKSRTCPLKPLERFLATLLGPSKDERHARLKLAIFSGTRSPLWENPARVARVISGFACATQPLLAHRHSWTLAATDWPARGMNQWLCTHPGCKAAQALPVGGNPNIVKSRR
jgi:pimeloyl-ACP methyl ester carboxylesterase